MTTIAPKLLAAAFLAILWHGPAGAETAAASADALPACDALEADAAAAVNCILEHGGRTILFDYVGDADSATLTVRQLAPGGDVLAISDPIAVEWVMTAPALRDINSDGRAELFIPVLTGNVNTRFQVWQFSDDAIFVPAGTLTGFGVDALEVAGNLVIATARSSAAEFVETAQTLGPDGLVPVYDMAVNFADRTCTFLDQSGIAAAGLDPDAIQSACEGREWN